MGGRITFHMTKIGFMGNLFFDKSFDISGYSGVCIFINSNARRGVRGINQYNTILDPLPFHFMGNIDKLDTPGTPNIDRFKTTHTSPLIFFVKLIINKHLSHIIMN